MVAWGWGGEKGMNSHLKFYVLPEELKEVVLQRKTGTLLEGILDKPNRCPQP